MGHGHSKHGSSSGGTNSTGSATSTSSASAHSSTPKPAVVCPALNTNGPPLRPIVGNMSFHTLSIIVAGAAAIFSCLLALFLIFRHATRFSNPPEQTQIIRIINIIPVFAIVCFLCVWQDAHALYIIPALDVGEAFPMAAFFLLMSTYIAPHQGDRDAFLSDSQVTGAPKGYKRLSLMVLQLVPVSIILWIATAVTLAANIYCATSNNPHFAHVFVTTIRMISTTVAIIAILRFYGMRKSILKPRGAFKQLLCFKIIVFLNFVQTFVFSWLTSSGKLHASARLTFNDLAYGLPALILSCEIAIIAPLFFWAFSPSQYVIGRGRHASQTGPIAHEYYGGPLGIKAILAALNIFDIVKTLAFGMKNIKARRGQKGMVEHRDGYIEGDGSESSPAGETLRQRV